MMVSLLSYTKVNNRSFKVNQGQIKILVFESFLEMGEAGITAQNIGRAVLKFFIVAGGGTILGIIFGFIGAYITK